MSTAAARRCPAAPAVPVGRCCVLLAAMLALAACHTTQRRVRQQDPSGLEIYLPQQASLTEYFQTTAVMVAPFTQPDSTAATTSAAGREIQVIYPSVNRAGGSPLYSHRIRVTTPADVPLALDQIDPSQSMLVLEPVEQSDLYRLVGVVHLPSHERPFDYFADKPGYLLRTNAD